MASPTTLTVQTTVAAAPEKAWELFTRPEHITQWNQASEDWHTTTATNDLREGGSFSYRMEAKDGSFGFDFAGTYRQVEPYSLIAFTLNDGRLVEVKFEPSGNGTAITETFEAESENPVEMQQMGWQLILDNYEKYAGLQS
ncbi:Uncharacterized conserved protein YndB, AHSA1/START domain [Cnuella takakiae]|uniref:Uncharacterized conserved protein YndB, AHSA1/START domain n=1 Tax=Cnuella takakiae TaxID=1302690 RepID=A0A1M5AAQ0_9BACT|nr:SRPBCC family protein [Cnuella takakiae]OLY92031.1 polyketide cyclase [Cnuella takakiae]SHF27358.1 Uncharacterized conserved protein YndB, AHSA1/START domain [Cnuella takakiae]